MFWFDLVINLKVYLKWNWHTRSFKALLYYQENLFHWHVVLSSNHLRCWIHRFWMTYLHQRYSNCLGTNCKRKIWSRRQKLWKCGPCSIVILLNTRTTTINSIFLCKYKIDERVFSFNFIPLESKREVGMGTTNHRWWYRYMVQDSAVYYWQVFGNFELVLSIFCRFTTISSIIYFHFLCSFLSFWNM